MEEGGRWRDSIVLIGLKKKVWRNHGKNRGVKSRSEQQKVWGIKVLQGGRFRVLK